MATATKMRGLCLKAWEVRAFLEGRKTQMRRPVKPMPGGQSEWLTVDGISSSPRVTICRLQADDGGDIGVQIAHPRGGPLGWVRCPFGEPGTRFYGKETWRYFGGNEYVYQEDRASVVYREDAPSLEQVEGAWKSPVTMPAWASRLTLELVDVRVERLQEISEADAMAEGVERLREEFAESTYRYAFAHKWDADRGPGSWERNDWVWVPNFRKIGG